MLGIEFIDLGWKDNRYMHAFGSLPGDILLASFEQAWQKMRQHGHPHAPGAHSITQAAV
ncbi:tryptophan 7-halogenase [Noviherbaspirillum pedocola]|uniref:Tryptophan 7-halogenase n=1 Tax=Noviherbaspirillum pedocola TaxID=2801341 RepID=A0A934SRG2_9BURK|nr:tryptophan 7-halogenase [Noviherbaspirillum pedocola]MBK4735225.1 tryptophan 7-halogenase [Noviherbaspirillum pedocola]